MIRKKWIKLTWVLALVLLPVLLGWVYQVVTAYPDEITMATGPPGGQFRVLSQSLAKEIENKPNVKVNTIATECFIDMCDALSQRLNGKLSRQRLEQRLVKVTDAIKNWNTQIST